MADILRAARLRPEFVRSAQVWLMEQSGLLRHEQQKRLRGSEVKPLWADNFDDIPAAPSLIIANEFFDCLPIRQFKLVNGGWREQLVGLSDDGTGLEMVLGKTPAPAEYELPDPAECKEGDVFEFKKISNISINHHDFYKNYLCIVRILYTEHLY